MKKATLTLGAGLILLTGLLLMPAIASAQEGITPIEGQWSELSMIGEPEEAWFDAAGHYHVRGQYGQLFWSGDIEGWEHWLANYNWNWDSETIAEWGTSSFTGLLFGEPVAFETSFSLNCAPTAGIQSCRASYVGHLDDGRKLHVWATRTPGAPMFYSGFISGQAQ